VSWPLRRRYTDTAAAFDSRLRRAPWPATQPAKHSPPDSICSASRRVRISARIYCRLVERVFPFSIRARSHRSRCDGLQNAFCRRKRFGSPSRNSTASCSPVEAPEKPPRGPSRRPPKLRRLRRWDCRANQEFTCLNVIDLSHGHVRVRPETLSSRANGEKCREDLSAVH